MFYTREGDDGTTKVLNKKPDVRVLKSSCQTEALGVLDELNSFLGLVKVKDKVTWSVDWKQPADIIHWVQNCLFTVQAEVAGSDKKITKEKVDEMERIIDTIEKELPKIKTFFISGGTEFAALLDVSRTLARKAEREVVKAVENGEIEMIRRSKVRRAKLYFIRRKAAKEIRHQMRRTMTARYEEETPIETAPVAVPIPAEEMAVATKKS